MEKIGKKFETVNKYMIAGEVGLIAVGALAFPPLAVLATEALVLDGATTAVAHSFKKGKS